MFSYYHCNCYIRRNSNPPPISHFPNNSPEKARQISCIDAEISRTEDAIVALVKQRALLKRKRNAFVPAVNLPPEVLTMIFEFACLPSSDDDTYMANGQECYELCPGGANLGLHIGAGALTPLFIGTVCLMWRNIAWGASQLWTSVNVRVNNKYADAQAALLRSWLSRSGQRPLTVRLIEDSESESEDLEDEWDLYVMSNVIIDVLVAHAHQLHSIDLFLPTTWKSALIRIAKCLPLLTHLTLRVADGSPSLPRVDIFAAAPQLREVTLVGYSVADVSLPWAQLECLNGEYFSAFECLETLRLCPRLRHCTLEQLYRGVFPIAPAPMMHAALEVLELLVDTSTELETLLAALTLPALRSFVLSVPHEEPLIPRVLPLIARSACALETLHLVGITPPEEDIVACLKVLPGLRELLLLNPETESGGKLTQRMLDLMNPTKHEGCDRVMNQGDEGGVGEGASGVGGEGCLIPNLERFVYQGAVAFTPHALVEFLVGRWHGTSFGYTADFDLQSGLWHVEDSGKAGVARSPHLKMCAPMLRSVTFTTTTQIRFEGADAAVVQGLMREGMHLEFLVDPNVD